MAAQLTKSDPLTATLRRAATVSSFDRIAAVLAAPAEHSHGSSLKELDAHNVFVQPQHRGTAHEVLFALLMLESRLSAAATVLFLPVDHVVDDEHVMTNSLATMADWIAEEPEAVHLLGAVPQGPHDQLGYIVPWHDSMQTPSGVYEFVERPDVNRARQLISAGGLWNTFIFGGTVAALMELFSPKFTAAMADLREALQSGSPELELSRAYHRLTSSDFSQELLARRIDSLKVLRLSQCGWWPLKSPALTSPPVSASALRSESRGGVREQRMRE